MAANKLRPLHILWQEGAEAAIHYGVNYGSMRAMMLAGIFNTGNLLYLGQRREKDWVKRGLLAANLSLDWYIEWNRATSTTGTLNAKELLDSLRHNSKHAEQYELIVLREPLHLSNNSSLRVDGAGRPGQGAVINIGKYLDLFNTRDLPRFQLLVEMLTMHELGHVFGLFPGTGNHNPTNDELRNSHCPNECVMHWIEDERLYMEIMLQPFCQQCLRQMQSFFAP